MKCGRDREKQGTKEHKGRQTGARKGAISMTKIPAYILTHQHQVQNEADYQITLTVKEGNYLALLQYRGK